MYRLSEKKEEIFNRYNTMLLRHHPPTFYHSIRVSNISVFLGNWYGLDKKDLTMLQYSALLHDIGKVTVPVAILEKPSPLNEGEWYMIRNHPIQGTVVIRPSDLHILRPCLDGIQYHHERWDGTGYPHGLAHTDIPLQGRIIAIADALDAMIFERPYKTQVTVKEAIEEIKNHQGTQFDPHLKINQIENIAEYLRIFTMQDLRKRAN